MLYVVTTAETVYEEYLVPADSEEEARAMASNPRMRVNLFSVPSDAPAWGHRSPPRRDIEVMGSREAEE